METDVIERASTLAVASVELTVVDGPDRGKRLVLGEPVSRIGTTAGNHLVLSDPTVSRVHCEIHVGQGEPRIVDPGSTNGTYVDGTRVREAWLSAGATVKVGSTTLRVDAASQPFRLPLSKSFSFGALMGGSVEMRRVYAVLERVSATDATVLVQGETGTGKEVVARSVHFASNRKSGPFVAIDCGAVADNLIESELFGHVRGAFSGAIGDREGLFEEASGGTLFLDEIGELPLAMQPKLLRALETREIRRVGSNKLTPIDVRVIAATNRPLAGAVNLGTFREDLYYRLAVVEVQLPPLRARREDIPALAMSFVERFTGQKGTIPVDMMSALLTRSWPGNVRELRNFIEQRVSLGLEGCAPASRRADYEVVLPPGFESLLPTKLPYQSAREAWLAPFERGYLKAKLAEAGGSVTKAADLAGINRRFFYRLMGRLGMSAGELLPERE